MLATDAHFQIRTRAAPPLDPNVDKLADPLLIQHDKRIMRQNTAFDVVRQKHTGIVTTQAQRGLRQIVGTK